ncbi:hypothetical protein [Halobacterium sp. CBA1126]|uniref:hypothetical protein n=1 Tax=Halobacterium sp. CBA1126 TaxID=2668074 RepID=UPI001E597D2B|nr:hypothetical protein [Halobacterium sp. CBA1126]
MFVGRHPHLSHPDTLYPLLHSTFAPESGWQNPFGIASPKLDETLAAMRTDGPADALGDVLEAYAERVPFTVVAVPEFLTARRTDLASARGRRPSARSRCSASSRPSTSTGRCARASSRRRSQRTATRSRGSSGGTASSSGCCTTRWRGPPATATRCSRGRPRPGRSTATT